MKRTDLAHQLTQLGWYVERQGGAHEIWGNGTGRAIAVPRHREINENTARAILRDAGKK